MAKVKKGRIVILVRDMSSHPVLHFYQVPSKYSKGYLSYRTDTKSTSNKTKGNNFYISTKYHKNIPKGIHLTEQTRNQCIITVNYNKGR